MLLELEARCPWRVIVLVVASRACAEPTPLQGEHMAPCQPPRQRYCRTTFDRAGHGEGYPDIATWIYWNISPTSRVGRRLSQSDNPRLAYTDGPSRSKPGSWEYAVEIRILAQDVRQLRYIFNQQMAIVQDRQSVRDVSATFAVTVTSPSPSPLL